jgi:hypothetical protein
MKDHNQDCGCATRFYVAGDRASKTAGSLAGVAAAPRYAAQPADLSFLTMASREREAQNLTGASQKWK